MAELKESYRGHEITLSREECLGGYDLLYFDIFTPDGTHVVGDFTEDDSALPDFMSVMKGRVDDELSDADPWGVSAECETCQGDATVCASVPGLRHCEKAQRALISQQEATANE